MRKRKKPSIWTIIKRVVTDTGGLARINGKPFWTIEPYVWSIGFIIWPFGWNNDRTPHVYFHVLLHVFPCVRFSFCWYNRSGWEQRKKERARKARKEAKENNVYL